MNEMKTAGASWLMLTGIVLVVLGVLSIASPAVAGTAVVIVIGVVLTLAGIIQLSQGFRGQGWRDRVAPLIMGTITTLGGIAVLAHPLLGLEVLAMILAIFFVVEGIWKIVTAYSYRPATGWLAMLLSGLLGFVLGWLIWTQWPLSGLWAVGVLVGVDLLTTGAALVTLAITVRRLRKTLQGAATA